MERSGSGGGGCCIARYTHGAPNYYAAAAYDLSKMDRIMLRYRPIAPKPVSGAGPTGLTPPLNDDVKAGSRGKRKNNGGNNSSGNNNNNNNKRRKASSRSPDDQVMIKSDGEQKWHVERVTLPLLPESPDLVSPRSNQSRPIQAKSSTPMWLSFDREVVGASVVVEGVTDTWLDGTGLGRTDEERRRRLDEDTCPGFVSDGWNRVWWTNGAFRRMVAGDKAEVAVAVRLGMKEKVELPKVKLFPAFTCRVRVQYGKDGSHTMTVPCDVWRMDGGGFAWRLDVKAALSLGR